MSFLCEIRSSTISWESLISGPESCTLSLGKTSENRAIKVSPHDFMPINDVELDVIIASAMFTKIYFSTRAQINWVPSNKPPGVLNIVYLESVIQLIFNALKTRMKLYLNQPKRAKEFSSRPYKVWIKWVSDLISKSNCFKSRTRASNHWTH